MAGGYLGKISAVISANTGDYVRKLGESAKETTNFARTVERTLSRASSEAARSLQSIYTPLQQFERALRAAASERLSFKGFDGAIRTVEELKKRLAGIKASDVDIVVKASGQKTLTDLRNVINDISTKDIDLFRNVGGLAGLQKLRAEIDSVSEAAQGVTVQPKISAAELDALIEKFSRIDDTQINAVIRVFGDRELDAALTKARQARDVFEGVTAPLSRTTQTFSQLSGEVQAAFVPALESAQREAEKLALSFSPERYAAATRSVASLTATVGQLAEAQRLASQVPTGRELAFSDPRLNANLRNAAAAGQQAAALPASAIAGDPEFSGLTSQLNRVSELAVAAAARLKSLRETGSPGQSQALAEYERLNGVLERLAGRLNQKFQIRLDAEKAVADAKRLEQALASTRDNIRFTITAQVQNFDQARQELSRLQGQVGQLEGGRSAFSDELLRLGNLVETGDISKLQDVRNLIGDIEERLAARKTLDIDTAAANRAAEQLAITLQSLRENADFVITGRPQNLQQVQSELQRILGQFDGLTEAQRTALSAPVANVINAVGRQDIDAAIEALQQLRQEAGAAISVNVDVSRAQERIRSINEAWDFAVRGVPASVAQVDSQFQSLASRISSLGIEDRLDLDPLIRDFRDSVVAGEPLIAQFERLLALQARLDAIDSPAVRSPDAGLGAGIEDGRRQLDVLRGAITSAKSQLDTLPASVRTEFIPAIQQAEANFRRLASAGVAAAATEIENAANEMAGLTAAIGRASQAASLLSFDDFMNNASVRQATGELQALQQILVGIEAVAGGPAAQAYDRYRQRLQQAINTGTTGLPEVRRELQALQQEAARAAAATGRISFGAAMRGIQRGGDIGRGGFDNYSLAAQQAAFAVDDFLSSTGGLDQKLRAVSNNITQLAFILGGTQGLFIGLGAVIGGQVVAGIVKFVNGGKTAEDQTNALNDALSRQKSLVQELAQAFESLGSAIAKRGFSEPQRRAAEFSDDLDRLARKQKELREGRIAGLDPAVQRERAEQARIDRQLKSETNAGRRVTLEQQRQESRARERAASEAAVQAAPTQQRVVDALFEAADAVFNAEAARFRQGDTSGRAIDPTLRRMSGRVDEAGVNPDPFTLLSLLRQQREELISSGLGQGFTGDLAVNDSIAELQTLIEQLEAAASEAADALAVNFLKSANAAANELETAQSRVAQAIESAVPGAVALQTVLDGLSRQVDEAQKRIKESIEDETLSPEDRKAVVEKAEKEIADARIRREEATAKAAELAFQRIVDPRSLLENVIGRSQQSLQDSGFGDGRVARDLRAIDANRQIIQERLNRQIADGASVNPFDRRRLEALNGQAAALEAATLALRAFGEALNSITQSAAQDVGSLQQRAEQARRDDIRFGTPDTAQRRSQAEADLRAGREAQRQVENSVQNARDRAEQQIVDNGTRLGERLRQIDDQLAVPAGQTSSTGVQGGTLAEREALRQERARLQAQADAAVENDPGVRAARRQQDKLTRQAEAAAGADRGRQIGMTDAQRAIEQTQAQLADVRDRADELSVTGKANEDIASFLRQSRENLGRDAAPAIFGMADQVMNAALQGPSRAALTAADINTSQGAAELNRLLRGDDANRNANIVELQKQNTTLTAINQGIQQMADNMGIVLDL